MKLAPLVRRTAYLATLAMATEGCWAADLGKALAKTPSAIWVSQQGIFDVERCILAVDTPGLPYVYRQPDQPDHTVIAYSAGVGVPIAIELTKTPQGTQITVRMSGPGLKHIPSGIETCATTGVKSGGAE